MRWITVFFVGWSAAAVGACSPSEKPVLARSTECGQLWTWELPDQVVLPPGDTAAWYASIQRDMTLARLNLIARAAEHFCTRMQRYPLDMAEILRDTGEAFGAEDCSLNAEFLVDAWDRPFRYRVSGEVPLVSSDGADGVENTDDDLVTATPGTDGARQIEVPADCRR